MSKAAYWILTIPDVDFIFPSPLPTSITYCKGQCEIGSDTGYKHWQVIVAYKQQQRLPAVKRFWGNTVHAEPTRSEAADDYVWKDDTAVPDTRFLLGRRPKKRNSAKDWADILDSAKRSKFDDIPPDVYIRYHGALKRIGVENAVPLAEERTCIVYWGDTGTGKSRDAWGQAGLDAYPKDPNSKFWDGYRGQSAVVIDEFRGTIGISHLLRWLDRYPVLVEVKGSSTCFKATKIWITSNLHPKDWYPDVDQETLQALLRRMTVTHYSKPM